MGLGGTRLVPNYAVKRTIAELAARGRLPPKGTSPRLATEVSQVAAAAEVLTVAEEPLPPPPPSGPRITAQYSERPHGFSEGASSASQGRQGFSEGGNSAKQKGGFSEGRQGFSDRNQTVRGGASSVRARSSTRARTRCTPASSRNGPRRSDKRQSPPGLEGAGSAGARKKKEKRAARPALAEWRRIE